MEEPSSSKELYEENYYLSFHDGSLSKKLLRFSRYKNKDTLDENEIDKKIAENLYNYPALKKPAYYQENPEIFNSYIQSPIGLKNIEIIKNELAICFSKIINWCKKRNLEVLNENQETRSVESRFSFFLNRIKNNEFSDKTYLFYAEGKKLIETIALLIENNSIDETYRINQLIALSINGNLNYCVEGCFSRFMSTAQHLKNYLSFNYPYILIRLVIEIAENLSISKHSNSAQIYTEILCKKAKVSISNYEIHAKNYLINNVLKELKLTKNIVNDTYTRIFDTPEIKKLLVYFLSVFKSKFTATTIVKFLQHEYFKKENIHFENGLSNVISTEKLETFLSMLGQDNDFNIHEIISLDENENPRFKKEDPLLITISERLINTEWFKFGFYSRWMDKYQRLLQPFEKLNIKVNMPLLYEKISKYRIFIGNSELTWFRLNDERYTMLEIIKSEYSLYGLLKIEVKSSMVQYLFENSEDLLNFFKRLPKDEHELYLRYLELNNFNFNVHILSKSLLNEIISPTNDQITQYDLLIYFNKLFSILDKESLNNFSDRFYISDLIQSAMNNNIHFFDTLNSNFITTFLDFFYFSNLIGYKKFSNLNFDLNSDLNKDLFKINNQVYLESSFDNIQFKLFLSNIKFTKSKLNNVYFKEKINNIEFSDSHLYAKIDYIENSLINGIKGDVEIDRCKNIEINRFYGDLNFISRVDGLEMAFTTGKKIILPNVKDSYFYNIKYDQFIINGQIVNTYFAMMDFSNTRFLPLENIRENIAGKLFTGNFNFKITQYDKHKMFFLKSRFSTESLIDFLKYPAIVHLDYNLFFFLRGTDLRLINFNNINIHELFKKYIKIDLGHCNLERVDLTHLFNTAEIDLSHANLKRAIFLDADTSKTIFNNADLSHCDLSKANLIHSKLVNAKIIETQLSIEQLFIFYKQGHYDFHSISLVGIYNLRMGESLEGVTLSSQALEHLLQSGYRNFRKFDLRFLSTNLKNVLQTTSDINLEGAIFDEWLSIPECNIPRHITKRSASCLSDLESINNVFKDLVFKKENQDYINSKQWITEYKNADYEKKQDLIKITKIIPLSDNSKISVNKVLHYENLKSFLGTIAHTVNQINLGILETETVFNFIEGNYQQALINLAFITSGPLLSKISKKILDSGNLNLLKGRFFLGNALRMSSPFFSKISSTFIVYDLVKEIKGMNSSNIISLLHVIDDNIYLSVDTTELGLEIAEILGYVEEGLSSTFGIYGSIATTIIFIGTDVYESVSNIDKLNKLLKLTSYEKIHEGLRVFFGLGIDEVLKKEIEKKQLNNFLTLKALALIKESPTIKNYFFSTLDRNSDYSNNTIILSSMRKLVFNRDQPDVPPDAILICYNSEVSIDPTMGYYCLNTIGISDVKPKLKNLTLINIEKGNDIVEGFLDSPNLIIVDSGYKLITGGNKEDIFILQNDNITGFFNGLEDIDTIDLSNFVPNLNILEINFFKNYLITNKTISIFNIEKILARTNKADKIIASCITKAIDSNGGNVFHNDYITFKHLNCTYSSFIKLLNFTTVVNHADSGNFTYFISKNNNGSSIQIHNKATQLIFFNNSLNDLNEIQFIDKKSSFDEVIFYFKTNDISESYTNQSIIEFTSFFIKFYPKRIKFYLNDETEIKIHKNHLLIYVKKTSFASVYDTLENYLKIANWLHATIIVNYDLYLFYISVHNYEVLQNNPILTSHLISAGKKNIFKILLSSKIIDTAPIYIYNHYNISDEDILDLRDISEAIKDHLNCEIFLNAQSVYTDLILFINLNNECDLPTQSILTITLVGAVDIWYSKINIIKNTLFLKFHKNKLSDEILSWSIVPHPINLNETKKILIISENDVEPNTLIKVPISIKNLFPVRIDNNDLDLTLISTEKEFFALVFLNFFNIKSRNNYFNLSIQHNEEKINLRDYKNISQSLLSSLSNISNEIDKNIFGVLTSNRRKRQISFLNYQKKIKGANNPFFTFKNKKNSFKLNQELTLSLNDNNKITIDIYIPISAFIHGSLSSVIDEIYDIIKVKPDFIEFIYLYLFKPILYISYLFDDDKYLNLLIYLLLNICFVPFTNLYFNSIEKFSHKCINFLLPIFLYSFCFNLPSVFYENNFISSSLFFLNSLNYFFVFKAGEFITTKFIQKAKKYFNNYNLFNEMQDNSSALFFRKKDDELNVNFPNNDDEIDNSVNIKMFN